MFPKENRFRFKDSLPKKIINSNSFSLRYGTNNFGKLKVAVVVSKKIDKRATVRNKLKRRILDSIRKNIKTEEPLDLIFYVKKGALDSENLEKEVRSAINNLAIQR